MRMPIATLLIVLGAVPAPGQTFDAKEPTASINLPTFDPRAWNAVRRLELPRRAEVTSRSGSEVRGRLIAVSDDRLTISHKHGTVEFAAPAVRRIRIGGDFTGTWTALSGIGGVAILPRRAIAEAKFLLGAIGAGVGLIVDTVRARRLHTVYEVGPLDDQETGVSAVPVNGGATLRLRGSFSSSTFSEGLSGFSEANRR